MSRRSSPSRRRSAVVGGVWFLPNSWPQGCAQGCCRCCVSSPVGVHMRATHECIGQGCGHISPYHYAGVCRRLVSNLDYKVTDEDIKVRVPVQVPGGATVGWRHRGQCAHHAAEEVSTDHMSCRIHRACFEALLLTSAMLPCLSAGAVWHSGHHQGVLHPLRQEVSFSPSSPAAAALIQHSVLRFTCQLAPSHATSVVVCLGGQLVSMQSARLA